MKLRIFTDGACSGNPGPGGWSMVFNMMDECRTFAGSELDTTNNRMELLAVIEALSELYNNPELYKDYDTFELYSDSAYVVNAITNGWLDNWEVRGWKTKQGDDVKNAKLWKRLKKLLSQVRITFYKVKGHDGDTFNELADKLAREACIKAKQEEQDAKTSR